MDHHTLELTIACLEAEGLKNLAKRPGRWFEDTFSLHPKTANSPLRPLITQ